VTGRDDTTDQEEPVIDAVGNPQSLLLLGGTSDIGLAVAARFAADSAQGQRALRVVLAARPSARLDAAVARLRGLGCEVSTVPFDARAPHTHAEVLDKAFADGDIDVTLVAFGVLGDQERAWTSVDAALELAEVNYTAAVSVGVLLAAKLAEQGHGSLVALSSVAGERARRANFVYGSTKAGMDAFYSGLTEALRPSGVHVAVVRPGFVHTRMTAGMKPVPLSVTPEQVADVVVAAVRTRREVAWAPPALRVVMSVLRHVPRAVFRRLPI
jgi:decaprenylphospho-beta-D-erythro-pentofuranosid-2-ulose 2-reductase